MSESINVKSLVQEVLGVNRLAVLETLMETYKDLGEEKSSDPISISAEGLGAQVTIKFHTRQGGAVTKTGLDRHEVEILSSESGVIAEEIKAAVIEEAASIAEEIGKEAGLTQQTEERENSGNRLKLNPGDFGVARSDDYVRVACFNADHPKMMEALQRIIDREKGGPERHINPNAGIERS